MILEANQSQRQNHIREFKIKLSNEAPKRRRKLKLLPSYSNPIYEGLQGEQFSKPLHNFGPWVTPEHQPRHFCSEIKFSISPSKQSITKKIKPNQKLVLPPYSQPQLQLPLKCNELHLTIKDVSIQKVTTLRQIQKQQMYSSFLNSVIEGKIMIPKTDVPINKIKQKLEEHIQTPKIISKVKKIDLLSRSPSQPTGKVIYNYCFAEEEKTERSVPQRATRQYWRLIKPEQLYSQRRLNEYLIRELQTHRLNKQK